MGSVPALGSSVMVALVGVIPETDRICTASMLRSRRMT